MDRISCFFFSSRRRHTRWNCDWSSDVCSSDLEEPEHLLNGGVRFLRRKLRDLADGARGRPRLDQRSEERRVGKECRSRCSLANCKKTQVRLTMHADDQWNN